MLRILALVAVAVVSSLTVGAAQDASPPPTADQVRAIIAQLNEARRRSDAKAFSELFTADGEFRVGKEIVGTGRDAIAAALQQPMVWSEVTPPRIENESVRFISADVALVDAIQTQYGSLIMKQSVPVAILLKRDAADWRIVSLRVYPPLMSAPSAPSQSH